MIKKIVLCLSLTLLILASLVTSTFALTASAEERMSPLFQKSAGDYYNYAPVGSKPMSIRNTSIIAATAFPGKSLIISAGEKVHWKMAFGSGERRMLRLAHLKESGINVMFATQTLSRGDFLTMVTLTLGQ